MMVVVGGGLMGSAVALELARRGRAVTVLEKAVVGAEASSAAAGILAPRMEAHGREPMRGLGLESLAMYEGWTRSLGADVGFRRTGLLAVGPDAPDVEAVRLEGGALRDVEPGLAADAAWWLPDEAAVDTRLLVGAVHAAAAAAGAMFSTGAEVASVRPDEVELVGGERLRGQVVVCAGAWTARVPGLERLPVRPVRGQLAALGGGGLRGIVFGGGGYLVPRVDEVVVGTTVEEVDFARGVTAAGVRKVLDTAVSLLPALAEAPFLRAWSGFRPGSPDMLPVLGRVGGVWVASGHYRNGILLAPITAKWMADAVCDGAALPSVYAPERFAPE